MSPGPRRSEDDGFVLLETIVSISLITVIMAALTSLFVTVIRVNSEQRALQVAVQVADSTASYVRSLPTSDLLTGRTAAAVTAQWSSAPSDVLPYLASMEQGLPTLAGGTAVLPMTLPAKVVHGIPYTVNVYLGWCHTAGVAGAVAPTACLTPATVHDQLRAVVAVSWPDRHCATSPTDPAPTCAYVSATLLSTGVDPVFTLNQAAAAVPVIALPSFADSAVGDLVDLQMGVQPGTGVPVLTWTKTGGTWPPGVSMDWTGHITGRITAQSSGPITVTVTDSFVRTASATFTWSVLPALQGSGPATRDDVLGAPIPALTLSATGGAGGPYTWSDPTGSLPVGLSITSAGVVSGTPTAVAPPYPHAYDVLLTVADKTVNRKATVAVRWTIRYPPVVVVNPGTRTDSVGHPVTPLQLAATGGQAPYTWSATGLPAGLTVTSSGLVTGTVSSVGSSAATITARDQQGTTAPVTFTWTVVAGPTIATPPTQSTSAGATVSVAVATTCTHSPCTYSASGLPGGLSFVGGVITGAPTTQGTVTGATVSVTDVDGVTATSGSFTWVVTPPVPPTVTTPGTLTSSVGSPVKIRVASTCSVGPCTYTLVDAPTGVSIDGTGVLTSTAIGGTATSYTTTRVSVTDKNGATATSAAFTWTVASQRFISATWPVATSPGDTPDQPLAYSCQPSNGIGTCTVSVTGLPSGIGLSTTAGNTTTNHPASIQVSPGTGTLWLNGTVAGNAARVGATVTLSVSGDLWSGTDSGTWTVQ